MYFALQKPRLESQGAAFPHVRWLSMGNVSPIEKGAATNVRRRKIPTLAYLADIFEILNNKQGRNSTILANYDHIQRLVAKLQLWSSRVSSANMARFRAWMNHLRCRAEELSSNNVREEFLDFKADSTVKEDIQLLTLEQFCLKIYKINPCVLCS
nr:unnamed protein product [Callosobruchus analis]